MEITPEQVNAALANVKDWLQRGQDGKYMITETEEDTLIYLNGCFSLRMIVVHALEGATKGKPRSLGIDDWDDECIPGN